MMALGVSAACGDTLPPDRAAETAPVAPEAAPPLPKRPSKIIVFGDSLSDSGNAYIGSLHSRAPSPPYFFGRFSDGPVWAELFAAHFGLQATAALRGGSNYAVGGAKAGSGADSLPNQVQLYLWLSAFSRPDPDALYVIFGGGNDIRSALKRADPAPALALAVFRIRRIIERLARHGAIDFLVPNVPNRGRTPAARARNTSAREAAMTVAFDRGLDLALSDFPARDHINLVRVDFWSAVEQALASPGRWGLTDIADPCLTQLEDDDPRGYRRCASPESYAFWDDIHPTVTGHRFLAATAIAAYEAAVRASPAIPRVPPMQDIAAADSSSSVSDVADEVLHLIRDRIAREMRTGR